MRKFIEKVLYIAVYQSTIAAQIGHVNVGTMVERSWLYAEGLALYL